MKNNPPPLLDAQQWINFLMLNYGMDIQTAQQLLLSLTLNSSSKSQTPLFELIEDQESHNKELTNLSESHSPSNSFTQPETVFLNDQQLQTNQQLSQKRKIIIGGFGTKGYDSTSHAIEYLYDLLGSKEDFEFQELIKENKEDIDSFVQDLEDQIKEDLKKGITIAYIHFSMNETPFIQFQKCSKNSFNLECPNNQKTIDSNLQQEFSFNSLFSSDYINSFLNHNNYWATFSTTPFKSTNNYLYFKTLQVTQGNSLLISLPSFINESKETISNFLKDFSQSLM